MKRQRNCRRPLGNGSAIQAASAASSQAEAIGKSGSSQGSTLSTPVELREKLGAFLLSLGVSDVGFSKPEAEGLEKTPYAVTLVVRLSNAIVDENGRRAHFDLF